MKHIIPFVLVAWLVLLNNPVYAQVEDSIYCGDLSEPDCKILSESAIAMQALESTTFSLEAEIRVKNIADMPFEELNFNLSGAGSLAADVPSVIDLQAGDLLGDNTVMFPIVADMLRDTAADMTFTLELPQELKRVLAGQDQALPENISLDMRMVDGVAYVNLADIAAAAPKANIPPGWVGIELAEFYDTMLPQMLEDMPITATFDIVPMMTSLMKPENLGQFVNIKRLPDSEIDGEMMAVLETSLDYVAMLEIPEFQDALLATTGELEANEVLGSIRAMYEGLTLVIIQNIGLEDKLIHSTEVQMEWDLSAFAEVTGQESAPLFAFNVMLIEESFNDAPEVVAPEEAMLLPIQQLFPAPARSR
jgi:hypothetical protein